MKDPRVNNIGPHYQCKRAFADGWEIEWFDCGSWGVITNPVFEETCEYRVVPDEDGWLPWYAHEGAVCPVADNARVQITGQIGSIAACSVVWHEWNGMYRVIKEAEKPESSDFESWVTRTLDDIDPSWREEVGMTTPHCAVAAIRRLADKRGYVPVEKLPSVNLDVSPLAELNRLHFELEALRKEYGK